LSGAGGGRSGGAITVNGNKRDFNKFRHISAYVLQQDSFFAELTVKETIMLSAKLRLPRSMTDEQKEERVDAIIAELGLTKVQDTYVGNELIRGVSGGERKRVNVGTELVTNPSLVFLDEPTSGLDSFNAQVGCMSFRILLLACLLISRPSAHGSRCRTSWTRC